MDKKLTYEEGMQALEEVVRKLESGNITLEESFEAYERAMELQKNIMALLQEGDRRIRVLTESGEQDMDAEEEA